MDRRGQGEVGKVLWELMGLIIVVAVAVILAVLISRSLAGGGNEDVATQYSFLSLSTIANQLAASPRPFEIVESQNVFVGDEYIIVGFSAGDKGKEVVEACGDNLERVSRPSQCGENSCLCLFPQTFGHDDFSRESVEDRSRAILCQQIRDADYITSFWYYAPEGIQTASGPALTQLEGLNIVDNNYPKNIYVQQMRGVCSSGVIPESYDELPPKPSLYAAPNCQLSGVDAKQPHSTYERKHAPFVLYGQCGSTSTELGTRQVYIEKLIVDGETFILISGPLSKEWIGERRTEVEDEFFKTSFLSGQEEFNKGNWDEAISHLEKFKEASSVYELDDDRVEDTNALLGEAYYQVGRYSEAANVFAEMIGEDGLYQFSEEYSRVTKGPSFRISVFPFPLTKTDHTFRRKIATEDIDELINRFDTLTSEKEGVPGIPYLEFIKAKLLIERGLDKSDTADFKSAERILEDILKTSTGDDPHLPNDAIRFSLARIKGRILILETTPDDSYVRDVLSMYRQFLDDTEDELKMLWMYNQVHTELAYHCDRLRKAYESAGGLPDSCDGMPDLGVSPGEREKLLEDHFAKNACLQETWRCSAPALGNLVHLAESLNNADSIELFKSKLEGVLSLRDSKVLGIDYRLQCSDSGVWEFSPCAEDTYCKNTVSIRDGRRLFARCEPFSDWWSPEEKVEE